MPKNKHPGIRIFQNTNYFESKIFFKKLYYNEIINNLIKPTEQTSLDQTKIDEMIKEYNENYLYFKAKNKVVIAYFNNKYYMVDGQHRIEMCKQLYEQDNNIDDYLICSWYTINTSDELRSLFNSINKDSYKNRFLLNQEESIQNKINNFIDLLKEYKSIFATRKTTGHIKTIEEFRDQLIQIRFFDNEKSEHKLLEDLLQKNKLFYEKYNYDSYIDKFEESFYKEEIKKIGTKKIISFKNTNFIDFLQDNTIKPYHKLRKGKKRINRPIRLACWNKEYNDQVEVCCPIKHCSNIMKKKDTKTWHAGHIISEYNGGSISIDNLKPICPQCNSSMGLMNWCKYEVILTESE